MTYSSSTSLSTHRPGTMSARIMQLLRERPRATREIAEGIGVNLKQAANIVGWLRMTGWIAASGATAPRGNAGPSPKIWKIAEDIK